MRTEALRALVAQRVAVDVEGVPHLTPLVDHVEVRGRLDADVPACVLEFDARAQAVGAAHRAAGHAARVRGRKTR